MKILKNIILISCMLIGSNHIAHADNSCAGACNNGDPGFCSSTGGCGCYCTPGETCEWTADAGRQC